MGRNIIFAVGELYHIYNRGTDKRKIFNGTSDYLRFLDGLHMFNQEENTISIYAQSFGDKGSRLNSDPLVRIHAYNLLPNHFHLILEELTEGGISNFMHRLGGGYSKYFNLQNKRSGSLWQGPFQAKHITYDKYLSYVLVYVHNNHHVHKLSCQAAKFNSLHEIECGAACNGATLVSSKYILKHHQSLEQYKKYSLDLLKESINKRKDKYKQDTKDDLTDLFME